MNGRNDDCPCAKLIGAGKCGPPPRFHDCDYVRARGEYEDFVTGFVTPDGNFLGQTSRNHRRQRWHPPFQRGRQRHDLASKPSEVRTLPSVNRLNSKDWSLVLFITSREVSDFNLNTFELFGFDQSPHFGRDKDDPFRSQEPSARADELPRANDLSVTTRGGFD